MVESKNNSVSARIRTLVLVLLTVIFIFPILLVVMNSFKSRLYVSTVPFSWPVKEMFVGFENFRIFPCIPSFRMGKHNGCRGNHSLYFHGSMVHCPRKRQGN